MIVPSGDEQEVLWERSQAPQLSRAVALHVPLGYLVVVDEYFAQLRTDQKLWTKSGGVGSLVM